MSRNPVLAAASVALLGACNDTSEVAPAALAPTVTSTGLALGASDLAGDGELWLFAAREDDGGGSDLDGDGDAFDRVVHVHDAASGVTRNTGLALDPRLPFLGVGGGLGLFAASESAGARADGNGDSDEDDVLAVVVDGATQTTRALGLALAGGFVPAVRDGTAAFLVSEAAQGGRDLDGDGSAGGAVLYLYHLAADEVVNTGLALASPLFLGDGRVAFFAREVGADLNGDGDPQDVAVLQVYDPADGSVANSGLETLGLPPLYAGGAWLVAVPEQGQDLDLNSDGDLDDLVLHVFDARLGVARNSGLSFGGAGSAVASRLPVGSERFGLLVPEIDGIDHDGDGELLDRVAFLYDPRENRLFNSRRAAARVEFAGPHLAFLALEGELAASGGPPPGGAPDGEAPAGGAGDGAFSPDLNGDGDELDAVAFLMNPVTGDTSNLRQDALDLAGTDELLLLARPESRADLNGDGDREDVVVHAYALESGRTTSTELASVAVFGAAGHDVLLYVDEAGEERDLTGDGDRSDAVYVVFDLAARREESLGLAGAGPFGFAALAGARVVLLASEAAQGRDLNGDGDRADEVLHRTE